MIKFITKRRLAALTSQRGRAEARVPAVQQRLARVKGERDQLLRERDERAVLVQEQAARLENKARAAQQWAQELAADLTQAHAELATLRRVEGWLREAVEHLVTVTEAPVTVIVNYGVVHDVQRSPEAAKRAVEKADPDSTTSWSPMTPQADRTVGWVLATLRMPELTEAERPPHWDDLSAHYRAENPREAETAPSAPTATAGAVTA